MRGDQCALAECKHRNKNGVALLKITAMLSFVANHKVCHDVAKKQKHETQVSDETYKKVTSKWKPTSKPVLWEFSLAKKLDPPLYSRSTEDH